MKVKTNKDNIEYAEMCKSLSKSMKEDIKKYEEDINIRGGYKTLKES